MPMPKPRSNESEEEFVSRFMGDDVMVREYPDEKQRLAVAHAQWEKKEKLSDIYTELYMADFEPPETGDAPKEVQDIVDGAYSSCRAKWVKDNPDDKENQNNKTSCAKQAWGAVRAAGWRKDAKGDWKKVEKLADMRDLVQSMLDGEFEEINNVEILNQWENAHRLKFTDTDMEQILDNFERLKEEKELIPNVKISHSDQQLIMQEVFGMADVEFGEELPNLGILDNFRLKATKKGKALVVDIKRIPKMLKGIFGGLYTSLSPEIVPNWRGELGKVVRGIVLSNNPSQKHIPDVYAMSEALRFDGNIILIEGGKNMPGENKDEKTVKLTDEQLEKAVLENENVIIKLADKLKGFFKPDDKKKKKKVVDDDDEGDDIVRLSASEYEDLKKSVAEINEIKKKLIEKDEKTISLSDAVAKIKKDAQIEKADALCDKAKRAGVPTVVVDKLRPILLADFGDKVIKLSRMVDEEMVEAEVTVHEIVKDVFENYPASERIDMSDRTSTDITPPSEDNMKKINAKKKEYMDAGDDEHTALMKAGRDLIK